jgi:hypothetical protein
VHRRSKHRRFVDDGDDLGDVALGRDTAGTAPGIDHVGDDLGDHDGEHDHRDHHDHDAFARPARGREAPPSPACGHRRRS